MPTLRDRYALEGGHPLIDVTITTVGSGKTHRTTANGTQKSDVQGVSQTTQIGATLAFASSKTTQSGGLSALNTLRLSGTYGDGCKLIIIPPINSSGEAVDCEVRPVVDGTPLEEHFNASAGINDCLFPAPFVTVGSYIRDIGVPYRKALRARMANLPLKATGWKYKSSLQFDVYSNMGWGNSAAPVTPLRIIILGDKMNSQELAALNGDLQAILADLAGAQQGGKAGYDPFSFVDKVPGFPAYAGRHEPPGRQITPDTWNALPNGPSQVGTQTQIYRFVRQAYPNQATGDNDQFFLTQSDSLGGTSDNVLSFNDLGFDHENSSKYLRLDLFGHRAGKHQAFVGVKVDDTVLPTTKGIAATSNVNLFPSGEVQPMRTPSNLFYPFGKSPWPIVAWKNKVSWFITPDGTAIDAEFSSTPTLQDSSQVAVGGIEIIPSA